MIDYLKVLDSNRESGPEFAATAKPRRARVKGKALTRGKRRAKLRKSTTSAKGKERADRKTSRKSMAKRKKGRTAAQKRATAKMIRAAKAKRRGHVKSPRKRARRSVSTPVRRKRRKARNSAPKPPKRRRKARRRAAEEWRGDSAGHARAARKGWRKRMGWRKRKARHGKRKARRTAKQRAASLRNLRKARAARRGSHKPRKRSVTRRRARRAAGTAHRASHGMTVHHGPGLSKYGRRRRARRNPSQYGLTGGELFVASIFGTLGFLGGDAVDRLIATHSLTDKGTKDANGNELYADNPPATGSYQGLFNPTAICAPMDLARWAAGIGVPAATFVVANFVKAPMVRASMQFAAFGWGVRVVGKGAIDAIAMLTKGTGTGQRLYDGEMRAGVLKANNGNQQAAELASLPSAGLGKAPQLGKAGDCAPCEAKNGAGYPSMPRETANQAQTPAPTPPPAMTSPAPPPPPPPAAPLPSFTSTLTGVPKKRDRFNWGDAAE